MGKPDKLNVHIVPHTHDDVGWTKTVDGYYYRCEQVINPTFPTQRLFFRNSKEPKNSNLTSVLPLFYRILFNFSIYLAVQYILDSVIEALVENPDRRYIYVEIAFFWRWWNEKSEDIRNTVKQLVNDG